MYGLPGDINEAAEMCANNHAEYRDWGWHDRPEKSEDVFIFHLLNRDSGCLDRANDKTIQSRLLEVDTHEEESEGVYWWTERHGHWAVGWCEPIVVRVYNHNREITAAFKELYECLNELDEYPCLNEELWSEMESEELWEAWSNYIWSELQRDIENELEIEDFEEFFRKQYVIHDKYTPETIEQDAYEIMHDQGLYEHHDDGPYVQTDKLMRAVIDFYPQLSMSKEDALTVHIGKSIPDMPGLKGI